MKFNDELLEEINVLLLFDMANLNEGIKVHKTAGAETIEAVTRLHNKKLISQTDGGYLTDLGVDAAEHAQNLYTILTTD